METPQIPSFWPASQIIPLRVSELVPYAKNARKHTENEIDDVVKSIDKYGWTMPILIDENKVLIAGHRRVLAASKKRIEFAPCMIARGWSEEMKRAYRIADNQFTISGEWDMDFLREELGDLEAMSFDMALTGFQDEELDKLLGTPLEEPEAEAANGEAKPREIVIRFDDEAAVAAFAKRLGVKITAKTKSMYWPRKTQRKHFGDAAPADPEF